MRRVRGSTVPTIPIAIVAGTDDRSRNLCTDATGVDGEMIHQRTASSAVQCFDNTLR
jgi:hypothetical protein